MGFEIFLRIFRNASTPLPVTINDSSLNEFYSLECCFKAIISQALNDSQLNYFFELLHIITFWFRNRNNQIKSEICDKRPATALTNFLFISSEPYSFPRKIV